MLLKRLTFSTVLLLALMAAGIATQSCQGGTAPLTVAQPTATARSETATASSEAQPPSRSTASPEATLDPPPTTVAQAPVAPSGNHSVVWVLDGANRAVAVDTRTGEKVSQTPRLFNYFWFYSAHDERWSYYLQLEPKDNASQIGLVAIDRVRGEVAPTIVLDTVAPFTLDDLAAVWFPEMFLSPNHQQVFVILAAKIDAKWLTRVYIVDLVQRRAAPITVFEREGIGDGPEYRTVVSADGSRLFVAQSLTRANSVSEASIRPMRLAVVNTIEKKVERFIEVPSGGFSPVGALAEGRTLYLMRSVVRGEQEVGYGFRAMDVNKATVEFEQQFDYAAGDQNPCGIPEMHLTPDGRALWMLCGDSVRFLDPQTGRIMVSVQLGKGGLDHFNLTYQRLSQDQKLLYVLFTSSQEVLVVDLVQRTLARHATFVDPKTSSLTPLERLSQLVLSGVEGLFVQTVSAKLDPEPIAVFSRDEQRLYMVEVDGLDSGDGVWGIETATLKPLGHWLKGKDIIGVQLSADGRELYAVSWKERTLYVLDALTGELRRSLEQVVSEPSGFISER